MTPFMIFSLFVLSALCFWMAGSMKRRAARAEAEEERRRQEQRRAAIRKQEEARRQQAMNAARRAAEQAAREERRKAEHSQKDAETARRRAEKLEYMRQLAELKERELAADREWRAAGKKASAPVRDCPQESNAAGPFAGEVLSFTGKILNFNRQQVIDITERKGGKGRETLRADCTILVVGKNPGTGKNSQLERAKKWHVKVITWQEWFKTIYGFLPASFEDAPESF